MTDQQTHTDYAHDTLRLRRLVGDDLEIRINHTPARPAPSVELPAAELLAMIDRLAPDAMRAYLRETAPDFVTDTLRPEVPEADSPEDVDEHPDRDDPTERAQLDRAWALERAITLCKNIGSQRAVIVANWILNGSEVHTSELGKIDR